MLDNVTTGAPLAMVIENTNTKSGDYSNLMTVPRPGHSDYPAYVKYGGNNDIRGGGHFSGRLTAPLVFAGSVAKQILSQMGVTIGAHIKQIGSVCDAVSDLNKTDKYLLDTLSSSTFSLIDETKEQAMRDEIEKARLSLDSVGGIIECFAVGLPVGLGGNMFDTVEGKLASILFGVPAVKGVEFGLGFGFADKIASEVNDQYEIKNGRVATLSNNNGGVLGGMTDGAPLSVSVAIKPTPSIAKKQKSVNLLTMEMQNSKFTAGTTRA